MNDVAWVVKSNGFMKTAKEKANYMINISADLKKKAFVKVELRS